MAVVGRTCAGAPVRRKARALAGSALFVFWWLGAIGPWPKAGRKTVSFGVLPRPSEFAVLLSAQSVAGAVIEIGVCLCGAIRRKLYTVLLL